MPSAVAAIALIAFLGLAAGQAIADARTTAEGVYTTEQARDGQAVHEKYCAKCHHISYYQAPFLIAWQNQPVTSLYDLIQMKMPQDQPGSLKPREYAAFLAYLFELNGLPAGDDKLSAKPADLQNILITRAE
jgi:polar amino acid transport system substrate-binding protein